MFGIFTTSLVFSNTAYCGQWSMISPSDVTLSAADQQVCVRYVDSECTKSDDSDSSIAYTVTFDLEHEDGRQETQTMHKGYGIWSTSHTGLLGVITLGAAELVADLTLSVTKLKPTKKRCEDFRKILLRKMCE